jgi:GTP-binding protein
VSLFPDVRFILSAAQASQFPADHGTEVAFAGRSNAGKSSAINVIVQRNGLARVSRTPGRTRLLNFFEVGAGRRIVDLPGYGFAAAPEAERRTWAPMIHALRRRKALRGLILIVDTRRGVAPEDENLIAWARDADERQNEDGKGEPLPVHVLLSKADKLTRNEAGKTLKAAKAILGDTVSVQLFSAQDRIGVDEAQRVLIAFLGAQ